MFKPIVIKKQRCFLAITRLLLGTLLLANCSGGGTSPLLSRNRIVPKTEVVAIETGGIRVTPPPGFCKDTSGSKISETSAVLIFANCGYLNTNGSRGSRNASFKGIVTTSITKTPTFKGGNDVAALSKFLSSRKGLKILSTTGSSKAVSIVDKRQSSDGVYVQLRDADAKLSQNVWKSFLNRSDHLVTVTLLQNKNTAMTSKQSMQFLQSYSETITLNPEKLAIQPVEQIRSSQQPTNNANTNRQSKPFNKVGILRRLLL